MRKTMSRERMVMVGVLVVVVMMVVGEVPVAKGQTSPSQCKEERRVITNACKPVIFGSNPSADCCQIVRVVHVECVCPYVTPKLATLIPVDRTYKQIKACGRAVPSKFKCGSITFP